MEPVGDADDLVVGYLLLQPAVANGAAADDDFQDAPVLHGDPFAEAPAFAEGVEPADHASGIASKFVGFLFELIQFLDHRHRQDNGVVGEGFNTGVVVQQNIRIQNKGFITHGCRSHSFQGQSLIGSYSCVEGMTWQARRNEEG